MTLKLKLIFYLRFSAGNYTKGHNSNSDQNRGIKLHLTNYNFNSNLNKLISTKYYQNDRLKQVKVFRHAHVAAAKLGKTEATDCKALVLGSSTLIESALLQLND